MTWFAFRGLNGGKAVDLAGSQEKQAVAEGFHGYGTASQAQAQPNAVNPLTRVFADAWIADYKAAVAEQAQPGGKNANILNPLTAAKAGAQGVETEVANATGINAIGDFFTTLGRSGTWVRVAKVVIGGVLVITGLAQLTGAGKVIEGVVK